MKLMKIILAALCGFIALAGIAGGSCLVYYLGIPHCVGEKKYAYRMSESHTVFDEYDLYGKWLVPVNAGENLTTVIYSHGAESNYRADMATLKSLAKSGIAVYTFDYYGWSKRSKGPDGKGDYFKGTPRGVDDSYQKQVVKQSGYLDHVIEHVKEADYVNKDKIYLLGSSMGGATVAAASVHHNEDISGIILQYPAINLVPGAMIDGDEYDVNQYAKKVLLLQGTADKIVPLSMSDSLAEHYNKTNPDHCSYVIYKGQPHVFNGKYKVIAAKEIYQFITK